MEKPFNPWCERLAGYHDREFVRSLATSTAVPLYNLDKLEPAQALAALDQAFDETYVVSERALDILMWILLNAQRSLETRYSSPPAFISALYSQNPPRTTVEPLCLTGLAGVGKSAFLQACERVLPKPSQTAIDLVHTSIPLQSIWRIEVSSRVNVREILTDLAKQANISLEISQNIARLQQLLKHNSFLNGVVLLAADEFQFVTQSQGANAKATKILLCLRDMNCPLVYCANYSLVNRLKRRNHEDRQRLLRNILVLERDDIDSPDWERLVAAYCSIAPKVFRISREDAADLWRLSGGLPRLLRHLLLCSYRIIRENGEKTVTLASCKRAYRSSEFAIMREDIELLATQAISGQPVPGRPDLNPPVSHASMTPPQAAEAIRNTRASQQASYMQESALNYEEQAASRTIQKNKRAATERPKTPKKKNYATLESLSVLKGKT